MTNDKYDFDEANEASVASPRICQFKKGDKFTGYINGVEDYPAEKAGKDNYGNDDFGNMIFKFVAIGDKNIDHKSDDGTASGQPEVNLIEEGEEYGYYVNYRSLLKPGQTRQLKGKGSALLAYPLGTIVQITFKGKVKSEKSAYSFKDISIIPAKNPDGTYMIHKDYKAAEDPSDNDFEKALNGDMD